LMKRSVWASAGKKSRAKVVFPAPKEKAPRISPKCLILLAYLAPRPGLEPGTYKLTGKQASQKPI